MQKKSKFNLFTLMMLLILGLTFQPAISAYAVCPDDIFFYMKLDETAGPDYADFIKDNDGTGSVTVTAAPTPPGGQVNGAQEFNGTDTEINVLADNSFDWQSDESFSIEFWTKIDSGAPTTGNQVIIGRNVGSLQWWVGINDGDGQIAFLLRDTTGAGNTADLQGVISATDPKNPTDGDWHHVVAVRDESTDTNLIYVDGFLQGSSTFDYGAGFGSATAALNIGHLNSGAYFDGLLDEVALYDRALSQDEIRANRDAGLAGNDVCAGAPPFVPFPDDTISLWHLDETAGPDYVDAFDGNSGTGSVTVTAAPTPPGGQVNGAQEFNGTDTEINVLADNSFDWQSDESFSIEFWTKIDSGAPTTGNQVIIGRNVGSLQWWVGINDGDGQIAFLLRDTTGAGNTADLQGVISATDPKNPTDGDWHHVVAVRDESTNTNLIYVDGFLQGSSTFDYGAGFGSATAALNIGHLNSGAYFDGLVDEVALYDRALSQDEIRAHRDAGLAGNGVQSLRPPPVADAGTDQTNIKEDTTGVTLDGSGSGIGYTGTTVAYLWEQTAGTAVINFAGTTANTATFTAPDVAAAGETLEFQLTVSADDGQSSTDTVTVGVVDKVAPVADAGPDQPNVTEGDTVTLDGSGSSDADGTIATYLWEQVTGTAVTLPGASATPTATFTAPDVAAAGETLTFKLTVTDDDGLTNSDNMSVTVADATGTLQADAGADQTVAPGAAVTLDASASTGTNPTYAWIQTAGTTVQLAGIDTATPTFTAPTAADISAAVLDTLTFQLTVTDASGSATDDVNVIVDDSVGRSSGGGGGGGGGCFINTMF